MGKSWTRGYGKYDVSANVASSRPTLEAIAALAGVSAMTVSRALNGGRGVSSATRRRLQALAKRLGYRRDTLAALLASKRSERRVAFREYIALVISHQHDEVKQSWTFSGFISGVEARAAELGYYVCPLWILDPAMTARRFADFLHTRNIRGGVIIPENFRTLPPRHQRAMRNLAWAAMGGVPRDPGYHFACNDHFATAARATNRVVSLGYRRPGFAILRRIDERGDRRFRGGFQSVQSELPTKERVPVCQISEFEPGPFVAWYRRYKPDVIITHNRRIAVADWLAPLGLRVPRDLGWVSLDVQPGDHQVAGIDQRSAIIGAAALDLVHGQLQRGEYGEPAVQKGVLIEGVWQDGASL